MTLLNLAMPQSFFHLLPLTPQKIIERHRPNLILFDGNIEEGRALRKAAADFDGARTVMMNSSDDLSLLAIETVVSEDTTAAGGNASLLAAQN
jgi:delta 1-pyrroline-5-carboxylate dehydrogenase